MSMLHWRRTTDLYFMCDREPRLAGSGLTLPRFISWGCMWLVSLIRSGEWWFEYCLIDWYGASGSRTLCFGKWNVTMHEFKSTKSSAPGTIKTQVSYTLETCGCLCEWLGQLYQGCMEIYCTETCKWWLWWLSELFANSFTASWASVEDVFVSACGRAAKSSWSYDCTSISMYRAL